MHPDANTLAVITRQAASPDDPNANEGRLVRLRARHWPRCSNLTCMQAADLAARFTALGASEVVLDEVAPQRSNVYGVWRVPGCTAWRGVDVHLDTVAVGHCTAYDPFTAFVDADGKLHGRGACDTKASFALCLSVLAELQRDNVALPTNLIGAYLALRACI
jgi:acetylornithine deacetylase/succinyl-diaminopimelate desuccinylase-like protein